MLAKQRFRGRAYTQALRQLLLSAVRHPGHLRRKALDMVLFLLEQALGDKHRHLHVLMPQLFKARVKDMLNIFPDRAAVRAYNHASAHR